jgi:HEPN domain-containing protein
MAAFGAFGGPSNKRDTRRMNPEDADNFARQNRDGMGLYSEAADDYVAARCCLMNGLFTGLRLASESVEKLLKAHLLFLNPSENVRQFGHDIPKLGERLSELTGLQDSDSRKELLLRLKKHYDTRYPDNAVDLKSKSTGELREIDELVVELIEQMPIPAEVKFRSGLYVQLFITEMQPELATWWTPPRWILSDNRALAPRLKALRQRCRAVLDMMTARDGGQTGS